MVYTVHRVGNFLLLLSIFLYVFSLLGMQMFAGKLKKDGVSPRSNFDNLY